MQKIKNSDFYLLQTIESIKNPTKFLIINKCNRVNLPTKQKNNMVSGLVKGLTVVAEIFFNFNSTEVKRSLKGLNPRKPAGPDKLEPLFLKIACDFIAECLCHTFNPTLAANKIPQQ